MKNRINIAAILLFLAVMPVGAETSSIRGHIKAIVVNEDDQQIYLRFARENRPAEIETLWLCPEATESTNVIRQAFDRGEPVAVHVRGVLSRCLTRVETTRQPSSSDVL